LLELYPLKSNLNPYFYCVEKEGMRYGMLDK